MSKLQFGSARVRRALLVTIALSAPVATAFLLASRDNRAEARDLKQAVPASPVGSPVTSAQALAQRAREAARMVMSKKTELAKQCWQPLSADRAQPSSSRHVLRVTFDPEGELVSHRVDDVPGQSRVDVGECLRAITLDGQIAATADPTTIAVNLALP